MTDAAPHPRRNRRPRQPGLIVLGVVLILSTPVLLLTAPEAGAWSLIAAVGGVAIVATGASRPYTSNPPPSLGARWNEQHHIDQEPL